MRKTNNILLCLAVLVSLSGCAGNNGEIDISAQSGSSAENMQTEASSTAAPATVQTTLATTAAAETSKPEPIDKGEETFLAGVDGLPVYSEEITSVQISENGAEKAIDYAELSQNDQFTVVCEGLAYAQAPNGINYNMFANPELFSDDCYIGEDIVNENPFVRLAVGDEICGLTVESCRTVFKNSYKPEEYSDRFFSYCEAEFSGEVTLTGYVTVTAFEPLYPGSEGRMSFFADENSDILPIINLVDWGENDNLYIHCHIISRGFYNDSVEIALGSIDEMEHISGFEYGDTNVRVKITLGDIRMSSNSVVTTAKLIDIEKI